MSIDADAVKRKNINLAENVYGHGVSSIRKRKIKRSPAENIFIVANAVFMTLVCFLTVYPFINTLAFALNEGPDAMRGSIYFWPRAFTIDNFRTVLSDPAIGRAYFITVSRTVVGIIFGLFITGMMAYGLSKKNLMFRKFYMMICVVGMIFHPGLIPIYMLYRDVGLQNNFLVYILPYATNVWYMILMKAFFEQIPAEIEESGKIDGASTFGIFIRLIIPVSMPIIATICIFNGVFHWNQWFDAYLFNARATELHPIQTHLYKIIAVAQQQATDAAESLEQTLMLTNITTIRAATTVVTVLPILFIYSLFQKHFIKGVMVGSLKG